MTTLTDNFNRADQGGLGTASGGGTWTQVNGGTTLNIVSNQCKNISGGTNRATYRLDSDLASADHEVFVTMVSGIAQNGVLARFDPTSNSDATETYYLAHANATALQLYKRVSGTFTQLGSDSTSVVNGDIVKLRCSGTAITTYINGTLKHNQTDSAITGNKRCGIYSSKDANIMDDWQANDLAAGSTVQFIMFQSTLSGVGSQGIFYGDRLQ